MKTCTICGEIKELELFGKEKRNKDGHKGQCKSCVAAYYKQYQADHRDEKVEYDKKYYAENREKKNAQNNQYSAEHRKEKAEYDRIYRERNREKIAADKKRYSEENYEKLSYRQKLYREEHLAEKAEYDKAYMRNRRNTDPAFKLLHNLRKRLWDAVKGNAKSASTMELVGCSIEHLQEHLENQFTDGMTWENQGEWHVDHIRPCASFDLSKAEDQRECFNYKNLQPLWAKDNLRKSDKLGRRL